MQPQGMGFQNTTQLRSMVHRLIVWNVWACLWERSINISKVEALLLPVSEHQFSSFEIDLSVLYYIKSDPSYSLCQFILMF